MRYNLTRIKYSSQKIRWKCGSTLSLIFHHTRVIKIHKEDPRIRPVINWKNAPNYNVAISLTCILESYVSLLPSFIVQNIPNLITDLKETEIHEISRLASLHTQNTYINKLMNITKFSFTNNLTNCCIKHESVELCRVVLSQKR
jgi:hypothetical protein